MHHNCIKRMENGFGEILFSFLCEIFIFIECDGGRTKPPSLRGLFGVGENFVWWFDDDNLKVKNAKNILIHLESFKIYFDFTMMTRDYLVQKST